MIIESFQNSSEFKKFTKTIQFGFEIEITFKSLTDKGFEFNTEVLRSIAGKTPPAKEVKTEVEKISKTLLEATKKAFPFIKQIKVITNSVPNNTDKHVLWLRKNRFTGTDGFEIITPPITYQEALEGLPVFIRMLKRVGASVENHYGWRIHVSENDLPKFNRITKLLDELVYRYSYKGKSIFYYFSNFFYLLGDFSFQFTDSNRKHNPFSKALEKQISFNFKLPNLEVRLNDVFHKCRNDLEKAGIVASNEKYLIDIKMPLKDLINFPPSQIGDIFGITVINKRAATAFRDMDTRLTEIRLVTKHGGIENRAPGGKKMISIFSNREKLKLLLMDSLWRYYIFFYMESVRKFFADENVEMFWNEFFADKIDNLCKISRQELIKSDMGFSVGIGSVEILKTLRKPTIIIYDGIKSDTILLKLALD